MIRLMAAASARNLHEAQLACTVHAHENLHGEHASQDAMPQNDKGRRAGRILSVFSNRSGTTSARSAAFEASTPAYLVR